MLFFQAVVNIKDGREEKVVYIKEDEFVGIVKAHASEDELTAFLYAIFDDLNLAGSVHLDQLDHLVAQKIRDLELPAGLDLSLGLLSGKRLLLKTMGEGVVYGLRGGESAKIIEGDKSAVGKVLQGDWFIFTFASEGFSEFPDQKESFEEFSQKIHAQKVESTALFANISAIGHKAKTSFGLQLPQGFRINRKVFRITIVSITLILLIGSVFIGYRRREKEKALRLYDASKNKVEQIIAQAEENAFFSPGEARDLFGKAEEEVLQLQESLPKRYVYLADDLQRFIEQRKSEVFRESQKDLEEFYDINLVFPKESENKGLEIRLLEGNFGILTAGGRIFTLDIENKKTQVFKTSGRNVRFISLLQDSEGLRVVVFSGEEVLLFGSSKDEPERLIGPEEIKGRIVDMLVYGKNIYLLDSDSDQIHKYTPVQEGYSGALEYLKEDIEISEKGRIAIDGSVFLADGQSIYKFFQGRRQDFVVDIPVENFVFDDIYTDTQLDQLYLLDKKNNNIYIVDKRTGEFVEQITHKIISAADDFVVYESRPYLLVGDKIYILK